MNLPSLFLEQTLFSCSDIGNFSQEASNEHLSIYLWKNIKVTGQSLYNTPCYNMDLDITWLSGPKIFLYREICTKEL